MCDGHMLMGIVVVHWVCLDDELHLQLQRLGTRCRHAHGRLVVAWDRERHGTVV